jgi:hypothetical protein
MNRSFCKIAYCALFFAALTQLAAQSTTTDSTTAWRNGRFQVDAAGVMSRSSIILGKPNLNATPAMPLGNGRLGVAVWSENGLMAQLNRADTLPDRLSPGEIIIPGLSVLTSAKDYSGRLNLYDGQFEEHGGGMTATAYLQPNTDTLVIDVTGAPANETQTAQLRLWAPRATKAEAKDRIGLLSQGWIDDTEPGASNRPFGSLAAITADGRDVSAAVTDPLTVTISFKPHENGHFRVTVACPHYDGKGDALAVARPALIPGVEATHKTWWHAYWNRVAMIRVSSKDGSGEYLENLRNIYLFAAAAEKGTEYPGSQAGVGDMLSSGRDMHQWASSAFWHWNLRMQVAANIGAGATDLNEPFFNLYRENLPTIEKWTHDNMNGLPGACISETMRFNGLGIEYESSWDTSHNEAVKLARDCDLAFRPYFNARTLSTGAEVSLWIWQQYLATNDPKFLADNYPVIAESARFLVAYQKLGPDGLLHTSPSNAHETQWDVTDPTTDISAAMALYPVAIQAAKVIGKDVSLVQKLQDALPKIPPFSRTQFTKPLTLLPPSADDDGADMIAESYQPGAQNHNGESIGLEPIWPYDLIGDTSPLFDLAKRTYQHRLSSRGSSWSFDPIQAARLEMGDEVEAALLRSTENSALCVNGFTGCGRRGGNAANAATPAASNRSMEFYVEQSGVAADALQEAIVQDYDGVIRIAPAAPSEWDFDGSVFVRGKTKVDVQVRHGVPSTVVIESGIAQSIKLRNPWPGQAVDITAGKSKVVAAATGKEITFHAAAGVSYLVERHDAPTADQHFEAIGGTPATSAKKLGPAQLGLFSDGN